MSIFDPKTAQNRKNLAHRDSQRGEPPFTAKLAKTKAWGAKVEKEGQNRKKLKNLRFWVGNPRHWVDLWVLRPRGAVGRKEAA
jgi:hypothetical protein